MTLTKEQRPRVLTPEASQISLAAALSLSELDAMAAMVDGAFVVLVRLAPSQRPVGLSPESEAPKYRRRVFLTAAAAEHAVRAAAARGETARLYLCELKPLHLVKGGE